MTSTYANRSKVRKEFELEMTFYPDRDTDPADFTAIIFRANIDNDLDCKNMIEDAAAGRFTGAAGRKFKFGTYRKSKDHGGDGSREKYSNGQWVSEGPRRDY